MKPSRRRTPAKAGARAAGPEQILGLFDNDWAVRIVQSLDRNPRLYPELQREFQTASPSTLAQILRNLQEAGLVWRKAYPTSPARMEYSLTSLGKSFIAPLQAFCEWAELHERELSAASVRRAKKSKSPEAKKEKSRKA